VNGDERQGAPLMKQIDENVTKMRKLVRSDHQLTCRMIADELDMNKETVRKILVQHLGMRKLAKKLDRGTEGETSHFVHGLCGTTSRKFFGLCHHW
jgi:DNA-directed RNA polymerase sigma subunit (sigma70/sigma32)